MLVADCSYCPPSTPGIVFGKNAIRQHILDTLMKGEEEYTLDMTMKVYVKKSSQL